MTNQPKWELIQNLGDVNPIDYGGYFVYRDTTGVYEEEAEKLISPETDTDSGTWTVYRFTLDRCKIVSGYLVPFRYDESWPHPVASYDEWFHDHIRSLAAFIGQTPEQLEQMFCSDNPCERAIAYEAIGEYHGYVNLDAYPLHFTNRAEVDARYGESRQ